MSAKIEFGPDTQCVPRDLSLLAYLAFLEGNEDQFNEAQMARYIRRNIAENKLNLATEVILLTIADALDHPQAYWKLRIKTPGRSGRRRTFSDMRALEDRDSGIAYDTWLALKRLNKMEAAVVEVGKNYGLSRAVVFQSITRARSSEKKLRGMLDTYPEIGLLERKRRETDPEYIEYTDWLDRYLPREDDKVD